MPEEEIKPREDFFQDKDTASKKPSREPFTISKKLVYLGIIMILIIAGFTIVMAKLINQNSQCTSNPFVYGASRIESSQGPANAFCSCQLNNGGAFWFDEEKVYTENPLFSGFN